MIISDSEPKNIQILKSAREENLSAKTVEYDTSFETNIRPKTFDTYIGQEALKNTLKISIEASKMRNVIYNILL